MFCCSAEDESPAFRKAVSDAGMKDALSKPINYDLLKNLLDHEMPDS